MQQTVVSLVRDRPSVLAGRAARGIRGRLSVAEVVEIAGMAAGAVPVGEVATLNHEVIDHSMEDGVVVIAIFDEGFEILNVLGSIARIQFDRDGSSVGAAVP